MSNKIEVICDNCGKEFLKYKRSNKSKKNFCSKKCHDDYKRGKSLEELLGKEKADELKNNLSILNSGENNPNYNNKWSDEQKKTQSELVKSKVDDLYREKAGSANRNKKFSKERIFAMHGHRTKESYNKPPMSEKTRKLVGKKSKEKFTEEYKIKQRLKFEELGLWVPLDEKSDYEIYYKESDWCDKMFNLIEDEQQLNLLKTNGVFNANKNVKGVVRDHKFSRRSGFCLKVFPKILRHPCNCELLTSIDNIKKKRSRYIDGDSHSLDDLFIKILNYENYWKEQEECLTLIERYKNGERWIR